MYLPETRYEKKERVIENIKMLVGLVAFVIVADIFGFLFWLAMGQTPADGFYIGALTANAIGYQQETCEQEISPAIAATYEAWEQIAQEYPKEIVVAKVFAYNSEVGQTDDDPYTMASGKKVYAGAVACPSRYAFGTEVEINGERFICEDRMAEEYRDGNYFDIWMLEKQDAINWGAKIVEVKIIK